MNMVSGQHMSIEQITGQYLSQKPVKNQTELSDVSFEDIFKQKQLALNAQTDSTLKFSKHAELRLKEREIALTESQNARLEDGVEQASEKGIKDSLVLVDSLAFIVNVPNRTVVTAIDQSETINHVFTNIDGAVIA